MKKLVGPFLIFISMSVHAATPAEVVDYKIRQSTWNIQIERVEGSCPPFQIAFATATTDTQKRVAYYIANTANISDSALQAFDTTQAGLAAANVFSESRPSSKLERAMMLVLLDEINALRTNASLSARTLAQLRTALKNKLDSGAAQ